MPETNQLIVDDIFLLVKNRNLHLNYVNHSKNAQIFQLAREIHPSAREQRVTKLTVILMSN